jgi:putative ABC transport system substrate-binding protein
VEGENIVIEQRYANGVPDRLPGLAAELVRLTVDVIVVGGTLDAKAAKAATTAIPIVFSIAGDPVGSGLVVSLARPGGNITGLSNLQGELGGKRLQLLKEAVPHASRIAVLINPANPTNAVDLQGARAAAQTLSVQLQVIEVRNPNEFAGAFAAMARGGAGALLTLADPVFGTDPSRLARLAAEYRLPAMFFEKVFVDAGGLMSFGPNISDQFRRAAVYVDKILKGTKPADIPVEQPTRFSLAINMTTAKTLGLAFPSSTLIQATEIVH